MSHLQELISRTIVTYCLTVFFVLDKKTEDDSQESKHVAKIIIYVILKLSKYIIISLCRRKYIVDLQ